MKVQRSLLFIGMLTFCLGGCYQVPEFEVVPSIALKSVDFKRGEVFDTLIVRVKFQDGDGDLGLSGRETDPPYHDYDFQPNLSTGEPCRFSDRFNTADCPGLPSEFNCVDYQKPPIRIDEELVNDTLFVKRNENQNNFILDIMTKENGQFEVFDFRKEFCVASLSGRFPRLRDNINAAGPLEGVIEFKAPSSAYFALFRNDTLKLRMYIKDRALHNSNIVESEAFTLNDLLEKE